MAIDFPATTGQATDGSFAHTASGVTWAWDGTTWKAQGVTGSYVLPTASATGLGGIKVGSGLTITNSVLSWDTTITDPVSIQNKLYFSNNFTNSTALNAVSNSTYQGMFALLDSDGHGYFSRGGTVNVAVTVGVDNVNGQATGVFYFDGVEKPALYSINRGVTFIFDQSNASNATYNSQAHPLMFSTGSDGDHNGNGHYMTGVQYKLDGANVTMAGYVSGFAAATTRTAEFTVAANAPDTLYYWCHSHTGQGNSFQVSQGPWVQLLDKSSSIGELRDVNLSTAPTNGQSLVWDNTNGYWKADTVSGGGGSSLSIQDEGSALSTAATTLNFVGAGVTASGTGAVKTITIAGYNDGAVDARLNTATATSGQILSWTGTDYDWVADQTGGGGSSLTIQDEGSALSTAATTLNFVGSGVTASGTGAVKTITIAGGGTSYANSDVDTHLNTSSASANQILSWNGSDYAWVTDQTGSGTGLSSRTTANATATIANNASANLTIAAAKTYALHKIQTSHAAWVTLYTDTTSRTQDASRTESTDPVAGSGVIAEVITSDGATQKITPAAMGYNDDGTPSTNAYVKVVNKSGNTAAVTVTLHFVPLEA